jgi:hypothetical protein
MHWSAHIIDTIPHTLKGSCGAIVDAFSTGVLSSVVFLLFADLARFHKCQGIIDVQEEVMFTLRGKSTGSFASSVWPRSRA